MKYALNRLVNSLGNGTKRSREHAMGIAAPVIRRISLCYELALNILRKKILVIDEPKLGLPSFCLLEGEDMIIFAQILFLGNQCSLV